MEFYCIPIDFSLSLAGINKLWLLCIDEESLIINKHLRKTKDRRHGRLSEQSLGLPNIIGKEQEVKKYVGSTGDTTKSFRL